MHTTMYTKCTLQCIQVERDVYNLQETDFNTHTAKTDVNHSYLGCITKPLI